jgi:PAS domain S-box-containing protein
MRRACDKDNHNLVMKLKLLCICLLFVLLPLVVLTRDGEVRANNIPVAINGVLDLRKWDFKKNGPVDLAGDFEFYWEQQLLPSDFSVGKIPRMNGFMKVPGYWNRRIDGRRGFPGVGYATYRVKVLLGNQRSDLALKMLEIGTAYVVYVNGKKVASAGIAGKRPETTVPQFLPQIVNLESAKKEMEIVFLVSNFHHRRGGIWDAVKLGDREELRWLREKRIGLDLFLLGGILIIALYNLGLVDLKRKDWSSLYFSIFCLLMGLRLLDTGERPFSLFFPNANWSLMTRLEYLSFYLAVPAFCLYMRSLFKDFSRRFLQLVTIGFLVLSGIVVSTDSRIFTHTLPFGQAFVLGTVVYCIYFLIKCWRQGREGTSALLFGFVILALAAVNDVMYNERVIATGYLVPFGCFIFIFSQSLFLSRRFSKALTTVEAQQREMKDTLEDYKQEITERIEVESALSESEEKYRTILHSIEDGYYEVDLRGDLSFFNDSMCRILGYTREELTGMNNRHYMSEETAKKVYETFNEVFRTGTPARALGWETVRKNGDRRFLEISISLMHDPDGQPVGFRGIARDITEKEEAEKQSRAQEQKLMQASKMVALGTLVSGVAHEVNNPNNFIMLNAPILKEAWNHAMPILKEYYEQNGDFLLGGMRYTEIRDNVPALFSGILEGSERIKRIVEDLKNYVREDPGDMRQSLDVNAVLSSAISLLTNMINKSTNRFVIEYGDDLPAITGNFQRLEQVAINLIQNACQAIDNRERGIFISSSFDPAGREVVILVRDEGSGIPGDALPHITDPFFTTRQDQGGVGLGLSISSKIVEELGGTLHFQSAASRGTTAEIRLLIGRQPSPGGTMP